MGFHQNNEIIFWSMNHFDMGCRPEGEKIILFSPIQSAPIGYNDLSMPIETQMGMANRADGRVGVRLLNIINIYNNIYNP